MSSNSEQVVSGCDCDRSKNINVTVVGVHSDSGFESKGGFFPLGVAGVSMSTGDCCSRNQFFHIGTWVRMLDYLFFHLLKNMCIMLSRPTPWMRWQVIRWWVLLALYVSLVHKVLGFLRKHLGISKSLSG